MSTVQALAELGGNYDMVMLQCSRVFLRAALQANGGCQAATALAIGLHRNTLYRHMRKAGIPTRVQRKARRKPMQRVTLTGAQDLVRPAVVGTAAVRTKAVASSVQVHDLAGVDHPVAQRAGVAEFCLGEGAVLAGTGHRPAAYSETKANLWNGCGSRKGPVAA